MVWLACLVLGTNMPAATGVDCAQAESYYLSRHVNASFLDSSYEFLRGRLAASREGERQLALRARVQVQLGERALTRDEKLAWYRAAKASAEELRARNAMNAEGHLWWATAQGSIGELQGVLSSVMMVGDLRREFELALRLDSDLALAHFALGRMYEEVPGLMGGSLNKAEEQYELGIAADANYTIVRVALARLLLKRGQLPAARTQLDRVLATREPTDPAEFHLDDEPAARTLLARLETEPY